VLDNRHIMLFDLYSSGHHVTYLRQLCEYWINRRCVGKLSVVLSESYYYKHKDFLVFLQSHQTKRLHVHIISGFILLENGGGIRNILKNDLLQKKVAQLFVEKLRPTHVVFLYMDHLQISLGYSLRFNYDVALSGIIFRPTLHYSSIGYPPASWKERMWHIRKKIILRYALRNKHLRFLFSLDPYAVPYLKKLSNQITCVALPDGYTETPAQKVPSVLRSELEIEPKRRIVLFLGVVCERKGICKVLESLDKLPTSTQKKLCLLIIGSAIKNESVRITKKVADLKRTNDVQIVWKNLFIPDNCIQDYFRCADIALVAYQRHVGSSQVLIRAAAEGVPVVGSNYGLVGKYIVRHHLGSTINTTKADAIAKALYDWIENGSLGSFNIERARAFAIQNQAEQFASTIFNTLK